MSSFESNKRHLWKLLIYFFNLKKSAAEAHRLLVEAYGDAALSERSLIISGFKSSRTVNLTSKTKNVAEGRKYTRNWKHYWMNSCQKELALTLGVTQQTISYRLKSLGIQKQGNWVPYELQPRNIECRFFTCEMLLARHK